MIFNCLEVNLSLLLAGLDVSYAKIGKFCLNYKTFFGGGGNAEIGTQESQGNCHRPNLKEEDWKFCASSFS